MNNNKISLSSISANFIAEIHYKLVGYSMPIGGNPKRIKHRVYIVAGVTNEVNGKGIGTQLFKTVGVIRLELTVRVNKVPNCLDVPPRK
ncbi:hypothetical protein V7024_22080 [Bacillus sp. JJ864]|uniref:hypothetical protein n=1 Tax=Bacillus sp. JJ864 TaxID=3122975 RepID=UPI002FFFC5C4